MAGKGLETYSLAELEAFVADDNAAERDATSTAALYTAMNTLEDEALAIRARRKVIGDEIRRRSMLEQREAKLAMLSREDRAALAREALAAERAEAAAAVPRRPRDQTVTLRQG